MEGTKLLEKRPVPGWGQRGPNDTLRAPRFAATPLAIWPSQFGLPQIMSAPQSAGERELAELIVSALNLEGVAPADIDPEAPLFKTGLGLDSIDALELALEISKRYGFQLRSDDENNVRIFSTLSSLAAHIEKNRVG
jgi:acyl carrier protein